MGIIQHIPDILVYFVPGFIFNSIYLYLRNTTQESNAKFLTSVVVSALLIAPFRLVARGYSDPRIECVAVSLIAVLLAPLANWVIGSKWIKEILIKWFNFSPAKNTWENVIDASKKQLITVKLKGVDYYICGCHYSHGDMERKPWIAINQIMKFGLSDDGTMGETVEDNWENKELYMIININDAEFIEVGSRIETDDEIIQIENQKL